MPHAYSTQSSVGSSSTAFGVPNLVKEPKTLILCFDGTGNTFSGSNADTNVVKILNKLDRNHPNQHHYYQTGLGTYDINEQSVNKTWLGEIKSSVSQTIDQGFGTTFDAHVIAGYRFLMRYYESGDKIYIFGFSRGAFTATFLSRMIYTVGLLCKGNEEMVPFAYRLYQRYLEGKTKTFMDAQQQQDKAGGAKASTRANGTEALLSEQAGAKAVPHDHEYEVARDEITAFSNAFCRKEQTCHCGEVGESNIKVYFLGIWDCVNSVAVLEQNARVPVRIKGTAQFVRHAVSVDERRVKFKPALLAQDIRESGPDHDEIKEVWFPGNHGDVGGGWPAVADHPLDSNKRMSFWERVKNFWTTRKPKEPSKDVATDPFQMSDVPLAWMISELESVGRRNPAAAVKWSKNKTGFLNGFQANKEQAMRGFMHDTLRFGYGTGFFKVLMWKFLECFPLVTRWELVGNKWVNVRFPLNMGDTRDIPTDAVLHESLLWRLDNVKSYWPSNNNGGDLPPCLKRKGSTVLFERVVEPRDEADPNHKTYTFAKPVRNGANRS